MAPEPNLDYQLSLNPSERPNKPENILLLIPGPTNISPRVTQALASVSFPTFDHEPCYEIMENIKTMTRYLFQTNNPFTYCQQTSGNGANETMIANLTEPGETVLIVVSGYWGFRLTEIAERHQLNIVTLKSNLGEILTLDDFERELKAHSPKALFLVHGETMSGHVQPLEGLGELCHRYGCLLGVDGVVSVGSVPVYFDRWQLDALVTAGQKAIGATAGVALLSFSERAHQRMLARKVPVPLYLDAILLGKYFLCFNKPRAYAYTFNSHALIAMHEALRELCETGLENWWERHRSAAEMLWEGLEKLGFTLTVKKEIRFAAVTIAKTPEDIDQKELRMHLMEKYNVMISYGVLSTAGLLRIGLLGYNARSQVVKYFLRVLEESLQHLRSKKGTTN